MGTLSHKIVMYPRHRRQKRHFSHKEQQINLKSNEVLNQKQI